MGGPARPAFRPGFCAAAVHDVFKSRQCQRLGRYSATTPEGVTHQFCRQHLPKAALPKAEPRPAPLLLPPGWMTETPTEPGQYLFVGMVRTTPQSLDPQLVRIGRAANDRWIAMAPKIYWNPKEFSGWWMRVTLPPAIQVLALDQILPLIVATIHTACCSRWKWGPYTTKEVERLSPLRDASVFQALVGMGVLVAKSPDEWEVYRIKDASRIEDATVELHAAWVAKGRPT